VTQFKVIQELQEYIIDALKRENIDVIYLPTPLLRGASLIESGSLDGEMPSSKENLKYFSNITYLKNPVIFTNLKIVYLRANKKYSYENLPNLQGAITLNNTILKDLSDKRSLQTTEVPTIPQAFEVLEKQRVDYLILSEDIAKGFMKAEPQKGNLFAIDSRFSELVPLYFAINSKKSFLLPKIEKALRAACQGDLQKYPHIKDLINKTL
jgi:ABC-type amino acid transport substrate-binding protein